MANVFSEQGIMEMLLPKINSEIRKAAEPVVQKAMQDIEAALRKQLGAIIVGFIDGSIDVMSDGREIRILVKHVNDKGDGK